MSARYAVLITYLNVGQLVFITHQKKNLFKKIGVFAYVVNNTTISPHACQRDDAMSKNYEH